MSTLCSEHSGCTKDIQHLFKVTDSNTKDITDLKEISLSLKYLVEKVVDRQDRYDEERKSFEAKTLEESKSTRKTMLWAGTLALTATGMITNYETAIPFFEKILKIFL